MSSKHSGVIVVRVSVQAKLWSVAASRNTQGTHGKCTKRVRALANKSGKLKGSRQSSQGWSWGTELGLAS